MHSVLNLPHKTVFGIRDLNAHEKKIKWSFEKLQDHKISIIFSNLFDS